MFPEKVDIDEVIGYCSFCGKEQRIVYKAVINSGMVIDVIKSGVNFVLKDCTPPGSPTKYSACDDCSEKTIIISEEINQ